MKDCKYCDKPLDNPRSHFCGDRCKYMYNSIKRDRESHLPPVKKRTAEWFYMITGTQQIKVKGAGRRCGHMVKGAMAGAVWEYIQELAVVNKENLERHFYGNRYGFLSAQLGNGLDITIREAKKKFGITKII